MNEKKGKWVPGLSAQVVYDGKIYGIQVPGRDGEAQKKLVDGVLVTIFALLSELPTGSAIRGLAETYCGIVDGGIKKRFGTFTEWSTDIDKTLSAKWANEFFAIIVEDHVRNVLKRDEKTKVLFELVKGPGGKFVSVVQEKGN